MVLTAEQRNLLYLIEAERVGIHKPILAALYVAHQQPVLSDGETGLGIVPVQTISLEQVADLLGQIQFAANTLRSLTDRLTGQGWQGRDFWDNTAGRYSDQFLQQVAAGYVPTALENNAALLEPCDGLILAQAYFDDLNTDYAGTQLAKNLSYLDPALLQLIENVPRFYRGLNFQRDALLEAVRIWRKLPTQQAAISSLGNPTAENLDQELLQFLQRVAPYYSGLPHQREALLRLVQLWRQQDSREAAIASLETDISPTTDLSILDPAFIAFVQRVPQYYSRSGQQRNALTEGYRLWYQLDSRVTVLTALGIDPNIFSTEQVNSTILQQASQQVDRELLNFIRRIPTSYQGTDTQRQALIRMVQLWRNITTQTQTIDVLLADVQQMTTARLGSPESAPPPVAAPLSVRPERWTLSTLELYASIVPDGQLTWADATRGGTRMPPDQATIDAIVRIATLAQQVRNQLERPLIITSWYRPPDVNRRVGGASQSRHIVGDAIDFYVEGLTGNQIYWALDPWWPGGLGRYIQFPYLSHIDARNYRARWQQ